MKDSKLFLSALAVASIFVFTAPAVANPTFSGPYSLHLNSPPDCAHGTGTACPPAGTHLDLHNSTLATNISFPYAGPLSVTLNTIPPNGVPQTFIVFCDDLVTKIFFNQTANGYFASDPGTPQDVLDYLNVGTSAGHEIMGLTARATYDLANGLLTPERGAAFQMAIWELEYGGSATFSGDAGFQSLVDSLIANASADYAFFTSAVLWEVPWTFSQLEDPCNPANVGLVTKDAPQGPGSAEFPNPNCQRRQGLILAIPGSGLRNVVPEPITLSLFGAGLVGVAAYRRRRRRNDI